MEAWACPRSGDTIDHGGTFDGDLLAPFQYPHIRTYIGEIRERTYTIVQLAFRAFALFSFMPRGGRVTIVFCKGEPSGSGGVKLP